MANSDEARFMAGPLAVTTEALNLNRAGTMVAGLDVSELVELAIMLVAMGALSGFLAGVFGIGGGAILVPVFYECFRLAGDRKSVV